MDADVPTVAPGPPEPRGRDIRRGAVLMVTVAYAWWAVGREPFSTAATVAVLAAGLTAVALGLLHPWSGVRAWARGARATRPLAGGGAGRWLVLTAVAAGWQLAAYLQHPRDDHPTLSSLTNALLDTQPARTAAFVLWLAAAAALARGGARR